MLPLISLFRSLISLGNRTQRVTYSSPTMATTNMDSNCENHKIGKYKTKNQTWWKETNSRQNQQGKKSKQNLSIIYNSNVKYEKTNVEKEHKIRQNRTEIQKESLNAKKVDLNSWTSTIENPLLKQIIMEQSKKKKLLEDVKFPQKSETKQGKNSEKQKNFFESEGFLHFKYLMKD